MRRRLLLVVVLSAVVLLTLGLVQSAFAESKTSQTYEINGIELCPQDWCGSAIFLGRVFDEEEPVGTWWVAAQHDELQEGAKGDVTAITGGQWGLRVGRVRLAGTLTGHLVYNGDNTFTVDASLVTSSGANLTLTGAILDHNYLIPRVYDGKLKLVD